MTHDPDIPSADTGLRQRKKDQTRQALLDCAARLFRERGFADTTVADIAACANVSTRTLFRYFETKEDLLLPDVEDLFAAVETALVAQPHDQPPMQAVCRAVLEGMLPFATSGLAGALSRPLAGTETLIAARMSQAFVAFEERLTRLVAQRLPQNVGDADLHAALIAGTALAAVRAAMRTSRARRAADPQSEAAGLLPQALRLIQEAGIPCS
ncbi:TetR/AcrR family transcriptional regulator [Streptomyces sp. NPDC014684]|uniref:TetR/AcrR family transcriptional regulator n=1 Tax=Streptomyces sp. NPDC014684 TaxID=3364880 RepID=UPI0036F5C252